MPPEEPPSQPAQPEQAAGSAPERPDLAPQVSGPPRRPSSPGLARRVVWVIAAAAALGVAVGIPILLATRSSTPAQRSALDAACRHLAQLDRAEAHYRRVVDEGGTFLGAADLDEIRDLAAELAAAADRLAGDAGPLARTGLTPVAHRVTRLADEVGRQAHALNTLTNATAPDVAGARQELVELLTCA